MAVATKKSGPGVKVSVDPRALYRPGVNAIGAQKVIKLFEKGYSAEDISDMMRVALPCIESFAPKVEPALEPEDTEIADLIGDEEEEAPKPAPKPTRKKATKKA